MNSANLSERDRAAKKNHAFPEVPANAKLGRSENETTARGGQEVTAFR